MTLKNLINKLDEIERKVEAKTYTPADVQWLIEELGEQAQTNQDLLEVVASAYQTGFKDAQAGENWKRDPVEVGRITFGRFQLESKRTMPHGNSRFDRLIAAIGLAGEVGETIDMLKKVEGHGHELSKVKLLSELGDILWYVSAIATYYELDLDTAAVGNIEKLRRRYPDGFNTEASQHRAD